MFGIDLMILALVGLVTLSAIGIAYGVMYNRINAEQKANSRIRKVKAAETDRTTLVANRDRTQELNKRRKNMQEQLSALEAKQLESNRNAAPPLADKIAQAGLQLSVAKFYLFSVIFGVIAAGFCFVMGASPMVSAGILFVATLGFPRFVINYLRNRRMKAFLNEFPNALEVMLRSIKSGLPLNDAIRMIAADGQEPVKSEFRRIVEAQQIGLGIPEACARLHDRVPMPETNFFAIVIAIQAQAGGNLSEALGNLARVLRDRKKMKAKINAMSMEAKASGAIIGALPFIVTLLVYLTTPDYIMIIFTHPTGHMILAASAIWMSIGIYVMRNMINFEV